MQNPAISFDVKINQSAEFTTDVFRLSVIVNNLISNAVKYQKPDEERPNIKITMDVDKHEAVIRIEDNGQGIKDEHLSNIFKMFFRSNSTVTGLGIGLYIVKEALTRIGGEINVQSTFGVGSSFSLRVPNKNFFEAEAAIVKATGQKNAVALVN
jgi:signal transduction histidine kinase